MNKRVLMILVFGVFFISCVSAIDIYVSNDSTRETAPCDIGNPCTLNFANQNAQAGDTVYLRGGVYIVGNRENLTNPGIKPQNSGIDGNPIIYSVYPGEIVNFVGLADQKIGSIGIWINAKSHIKVTGKEPYNLRLSKMAVNILIGPWGGWDPIGDSSYNEISYVYAYDSFQNASWSQHYQGNAVWDRAYYNHIHDCRFEKHGYIAAGTSLDNEGNLFDLGSELADENTRTQYNVIENNEFLHGGHATFGFFGDRNIVRNNYFHNEEWYTVKDIDTYPDMEYGYRNIIGDGAPGYVGYNVFEGNRIGHASPNPSVLWVVSGNNSGWCEKGVYCPISGTTYWHWGGTGMKLCHPYNILRYNSFFSDDSDAFSLGTYQPPYNAKASYNYIYNNVFFKNGEYLKIPTEDYQYYKPISLGYTGNGDYLVMYSSVFKNNLFYDNANVDSNSIVWGLGNGGPISEALDPTKGNVVLENNFNGPITYVSEVNPMFVNPDLSVPSSWTLPDLNLQSSSPAIDNGTYLTQTNGSGTSSTNLIVDDSLYFQDGNFGQGLLDWPSNIDIHADWIAIGSVNNVVQISSINYSSNTITLSSPMTWSDNDPVWLYRKSDGEIVLYGDAPDVGAYEYQENSGEIWADNCSQEAVQQAIDSASDGDTVRVPAGVCVWNQTITINKRIALIGEGKDSTIINNALITLPNGLDDWRISGFYFNGTSGVCIHLGQFRNNNLAENWRIDNNKFEGYSNWIYLDCWNQGVIDNNEFYNPLSTGIYAFADDEYSWNRPVVYGSQNFTFIENNLFSTNIPGSGHFVMVNQGGKAVIRYNQIEEISPGYWESPVDSHGKCHGSSIQSGRAWIVYENNFSRSGASICCRAMNMRGGTGFIFNNFLDKSNSNYIQSGNSADIQLQEYRVSSDPGNLGISDNCDGYPVATISQSCLLTNGGEGYPCYEQIGRGRYGNQSEPTYIWNNMDHLNNLADIYIETKDIGFIKNNRDYYHETTSFDGSSGIGVGTYSEMQAISNCNESVGFWVVDRGSWNTLGEDGQLFRCDDSNNWELYYEPYTYPHPLRNENTTQTCNHPAEQGTPDCKIDMDELTTYVNSWKSDSSISINSVMEAINYWKQGSYN